MPAENNEGEAAEVTRIKSQIASLADKRFGAGASRYFLAQLGSDLGDDRRILEKITRSKLSDFVRREFSYKIGLTGPHNNELFLQRPPEAGPATEPPRVKIPRYISKFWAAFLIPLGEAEKRYISLHTLEFGPNPSGTPSEDADIREIAAEFVAPADKISSVTEIGERIDKWLHQQGLNRAAFLVQSRQATSETFETLLDEILTALDSEQLKRVSLPLDVVRTLRRRRRTA